MALNWLAGEIVGDVAGLAEHFGRKAGVLPNWLADILDTVDDYAIVNSLLESGGVLSETQPTTTVGQIGKSLMPLTWLAGGGGLVKAARIGANVAKPFTATAVEAKPVDQVTPTTEVQKPDSGKMTMPDMLANAYIAQALADAERLRNYAKWMGTQQNMAELYTQWYEDFPRERERVLSQMSDIYFGR